MLVEQITPLGAVSNYTYDAAGQLCSHTGPLGALLTFAPTAWYPAYEQAGGAFGLTPVEDQQLGGLIMWVPGGIAYVIAGLALVGRLLARPDVTPASAARPALPRSGAS